VFGLLSIEFLSIGGDTENLNNAVAIILNRSAPTDAAEDQSIRTELSVLANRICNKDHFQVLEVERSASDEEIRIACACLAKRTHPDRFSSASSSVRQLAAQVFERVAEAHGGISTSEGRTLYATQLARGKKLDAVPDEGRRALAAEIEFQKGESKMAARDYEGALLCFGKAMGKFPSEGEYRSH
jgi:curved DNA-binding protein CbpA